ncbi:hypothetical protein EPUL_000327 [Erysiphe pulchra]|uniref:Helitron helicase-like domain-containing protein n=1 Tax=Erysiphe pulchra TaxID=225359 RepID=A0A2S4Q1J4_9PEZI|nr:hypothetical protein EPUL_000327 [Erysiphe pulchra]
MVLSQGDVNIPGWAFIDNTMRCRVNIKYPSLIAAARTGLALVLATKYRQALTDDKPFLYLSYSDSQEYITHLQAREALPDDHDSIFVTEYGAQFLNDGNISNQRNEDIAENATSGVYGNNAMAITWAIGNPSTFPTFTANPSWLEIMENLEHNPTPDSRPDLVAKVFKLKLDQHLYDIKERHVCGVHIGSEYSISEYSIEYQKRGLPHAHLLLFLHPDCVPRTPEKVDELVRA